MCKGEGGILKVNFSLKTSFYRLCFDEFNKFFTKIADFENCNIRLQSCVVWEIFFEMSNKWPILMKRSLTGKLSLQGTFSDIAITSIFLTVSFNCW